MPVEDIVAERAALTGLVLPRRQLLRKGVRIAAIADRDRRHGVHVVRHLVGLADLVDKRVGSLDVIQVGMRVNEGGNRVGRDFSDAIEQAIDEQVFWRIDKQGLYLANVDESRSLGSKQVPFEPGIKTIMSRRPDDDPFLPVLAKGDLREFEQTWPVLHLHRVKPAALKELSEFDRASLRSVITEKLESLFLMQTANEVAY